MDFHNREEAGRLLAAELKKYKRRDAVVMALPRGGVVVGAEVAKALELPLGLILVRKISHPSNPEYAVGAVAENERPIYNEREVVGVDGLWLQLEEEAAEELIERRRQLYFNHAHTEPNVRDKDVIIIDDGIATGLTMIAAVGWARSHGAGRIIVAAPVAARDVMRTLAAVADEVKITRDPNLFRGAVGAHYAHFDQVDDLTVRQLVVNAATVKIPGTHGA